MSFRRLRDLLEANMAKSKSHRKGKGKGQRSSAGAHRNFGLQVQVPALRVRLPYSYQGSIVESSAALGGSYTFKINDVFDPDFSGGGLQPLGFDQYSQFYGRYHVHGFRYEVTFSTRTAAPIYIGTHLSPQSTLPAVAIAWFVQNRTVRTAGLGGTSGSSNVRVLRGTANLPDTFGITRQEYLSDQDFTATTSASPSRVAFLHIWVVGRTVVATSDISVRLWYDVEFSQPVALSMS